MFIDLLWLALGIACLIAGGELLVRGGSNLARRLGVAPMVIGLTIVSFGTSAPELAVAIGAAISGSGGVTFGNVFGSNMANVGLILGCAALLRPVPIQAPVIRRELPLMIMITGVASVLGLDAWLRGSNSLYDRIDGIVLWLFFGVFLYTTVVSVLRRRRVKANEELLEESAEDAGDPNSSIPLSLVYMVVGLVLLIFGGDWTVTTAQSIARMMSVPESLIALTMIAIGTSLPELVTTVIAVSKGHSDLAVGNVIGSNIFNLGFVLSTASLMVPTPVPVGGAIDILVNLAISTLFFLLAFTYQRHLVRLEGALLLFAYIGYVIWRSLTL